MGASESERAPRPAPIDLLQAATTQRRVRPLRRDTIRARPFYCLAPAGPSSCARALGLALASRWEGANVRVFSARHVARGRNSILAPRYWPSEDIPNARRSSRVRNLRVSRATHLEAQSGRNSPGRRRRHCRTAGILPEYWHSIIRTRLIVPLLAASSRSLSGRAGPARVERARLLSLFRARSPRVGALL